MQTDFKGKKCGICGKPATSQCAKLECWDQYMCDFHECPQCHPESHRNSGQYTEEDQIKEENERKEKARQMESSSEDDSESQDISPAPPLEEVQGE